MQDESVEAAELCMRRADWDGAIKLWKQVQLSLPNQPVGFLGEGLALMSSGRIDEAEIILNLSRRRFPDHFWTAHHFAAAAVRRGNWSEALNRWRELQRLFPDAPSGYVGEGEALISLDRLDEASDRLEVANERFPDDVWSAHYYASVAARKKQWDIALDRWRGIQRRFPNHPSGYVGEGEILAILKRFDESDSILDTARQRFPLEFWPAHHYARIASQQGHWATAIRRWTTVKKQFPDKHQSFESLIEAYRRNGDINSAIAVIDEFEERFGPIEFAALARLEIAVLKDEPAESVEIWRKVPRQFHNEKYFQLTCRLLLKWIAHPAAKDFLRELLIEPDDRSSTWRPKLAEMLFDLEIADYALFDSLKQMTYSEVENSGPLADTSSVSTKIIIKTMLGFASAEDIDYCIDTFLHDSRQSVVLCMFHTRPRIHIHQLNESLARAIDDPIRLQRIITDPFFAFNFLLLISVFSPVLLNSLLVAYMRARLGKQYSGNTAAADAALVEIFSKHGSRDSATERINEPVNKTTGRIPRIAVCISGQLRGYEEAWASWNRSGIFANCRFFVHTWDDVGRRFPERGHLNRCFSGSLLMALQRVMNVEGYEGLILRYPTMFSAFREKATVTTDKLKNVYGTEFVVVDNENAPGFAGFSNSQKMYYKIEQCFSLIPNRDDFDIFVRIRPDREITWQNVDWDKVLHNSIRDKMVYTDFGRGITNVGYVMADQFAAGSNESMQVYSRAFSFTRESKETNRFGVPFDYRPHVNLAFATLFGGVRIEPMRHIKFDKFFDPPSPDLGALRRLISADVRSRIGDERDQEVLRAVDEDVLATSNDIR